MPYLFSLDKITIIGDLVSAVIGFFASAIIYYIVLRTKRKLRVAFIYFLTASLLYVAIKFFRVFKEIGIFNGDFNYALLLALMNLFFIILFVLGVAVFFRVINNLCTVPDHLGHKSRKKARRGSTRNAKR